MVYLQVLGFLGLVYSGGFVLPLVYCRVRRRMPWHQCIVPAVLGFVLFLLLATSVADLGYEKFRGMPVAATVALISLIAVPYLLSFWLIFQRRRCVGKHGARSNT